jgi:hypothetical protein
LILNSTQQVDMQQLPKLKQLQHRWVYLNPYFIISWTLFLVDSVAESNLLVFSFQALRLCCSMSQQTTWMLIQLSGSVTTSLTILAD